MNDQMMAAYTALLSNEQDKMAKPFRGGFDYSPRTPGFSEGMGRVRADFAGQVMGRDQSRYDDKMNLLRQMLSGGGYSMPSYVSPQMPSQQEPPLTHYQAPSPYGQNSLSQWYRGMR